MNSYPHGNPLEEARLLLPWYITGRLTEAEKTLVETMLAQYPELREEYEREINMVGLIRENSSLLQLTALDTTQQRLDKLMKRIERTDHDKADTETSHFPPPVAKPAKAGRWREFLRGLWPENGWLTPANAVFASLLAIQAGFIGWYAHAMTSNNTETVYVSASVVENKQPLPIVKGMVLLVDFNEESKFQQVRDFLRQWNARIMDGPDSGNLFRIEVRDVNPDDKRSDAVLQQMQQDQTLVSFIGREY